MDMTERVSLEGLRYAHVVAETHSFSAAARACGVTQPSLSNGVAKLEQRLGGRLFDRSPRGVTPTAFGARLLPLIGQAVANLDAVTAEANRLTRTDAPGFRLGVSPLINPALVARIYTAVCGLDPHRELVLREADMVWLQEALNGQDLDVILVPAVTQLPRHRHRIIDREAVVLIDSLPATRCAEPVDLRSVGDREFLLVPDSCGLRTFTTGLFAEHGVHLHPAASEPSSYSVLEQWATMGLGSALLPLSKLSAPDTPHRRLRCDGQLVQIAYEAVWRPDSPLAEDIAELADVLTDQRPDQGAHR
ncbi:LysR family transcriptional regulator [Mycolicibacillus parakoreensis]|uniref:LysR family transcriptional regulator n=1 Tax=Mycolicibacillus parakoreensis TaxID=1069221 RepID=A0ABY3TZS9_9MYCO|nr:LysR family transcriptional regulator [Mycolicibacillus parakoreensis]ULN53227.1 LysR family transcriptional regulator [Mycolicibacillus parakoreensis]